MTAVFKKYDVQKTGFLFFHDFLTAVRCNLHFPLWYFLFWFLLSACKLPAPFFSQKWAAHNLAQPTVSVDPPSCPPQRSSWISPSSDFPSQRTVLLSANPPPLFQSSTKSMISWKKWYSWSLIVNKSGNSTQRQCFSCAACWSSMNKKWRKWRKCSKAANTVTHSAHHAHAHTYTHTHTILSLRQLLPPSYLAAHASLPQAKHRRALSAGCQRDHDFPCDNVYENLFLWLICHFSRATE